MNIIGLGTAACKVANFFNTWPQYDVYCVDTANAGYKNFIHVQEQETHEAYEENFCSEDFKHINGPVVLFVAGSGTISGMCLRLLEALSENELTVFYIKPDISSLPQQSKTHHKITFGVLQQYARSNMLSRLIVVDNKNVEDVLGEVSIVNYWNNINGAIANTYHMINFFENTEPLLTNFGRIGKTSKLATFSVVNFDTFKEKLLYNIEKPRFKRYFFGVNEATLQNEKDLLHKIRSYIDENTDENVHSSFAIYSTDYEHNYAYSIQYASMIQEENIS